ncbi:MAG: hypothetical protein GXP49_07490 [Deltaproteobacteria bacterium]|nr:hypothetical protein [Deltaproteobacteria bacterium]
MNRKNWTRWLALSAAVGLLLPRAIGCNGSGMSCDLGCGGGSGGTGCAAIPGGFPDDQKDKSGNSVQMRLTSNGFAFVEDHFAEIIASFLPDGLSFPIPATTGKANLALGGGACYELCTYDQQLCNVTVDIGDVSLQLAPPNHIKVTIVLTNLHQQIPIKIAPMAFNACIGWTKCKVTLDSDNFPATMDINLNIDPNTGLLSLDMGDPVFDLNNVQIGLKDCSGLGIVLEWIFPLLEGVLKNYAAGSIKDAVSNAMASMMCAQCNTAADCPSGSGATCDNGTCMVGDKCVPLPLGAEGEADIGAMLSSVAPGLSAKLWLWLYAGGYAEVVDDGLSLGIMTGIMAPERSILAPPADPPDDPPAQRIDFGNELDGDPYMFGVGVSEEFLDKAMFAIYESGALNISIGSDLSDMISTNLFGLLLPSLNTLTMGKNAPMALALNPRAPGDIKIGEGSYYKCDACPDGSTCDDASGFCLNKDGQKVIEDPLLTIIMKDMAMDFYAMVDQRFTRLFRVQFDMSIGLNLEFLPDNTVQPVIGSIDLENTQASNGELVAENTDALANLLPQLIDMALPMLMQNLNPIQIPAFQGFKLQIKTIRPELEIDDPDNPGQKKWSAFAIFGSLDLAQNPLPPAVDTKAVIAKLNIPRYPLLKRFRPGLEEPQVVLNLSGSKPPAGKGRLEYSYKVDDSLWSAFSPATTVRVRSPRLLLQGKHVIEVRARLEGDYRTLDPSPAKVEFTVDSMPPMLKFARDGDVLRVLARDGVYKPDQVQVYYKVTKDKNTLVDWTRGSKLELDKLPKGLLVVSARATDPAGNTATKILKLKNSTAPASGCSAVNGDNMPGGMLFAFLAVMLSLLVSRKGSVSKYLKLLSLLALLGVFSTGLVSCSDSSPSHHAGDTDTDVDTDTDTDTGTGECGVLNDACDDKGNPCCDGFACVSDKCYKICASDQDCPDLYFCDKRSRICLPPDCFKDEDCGEDQYCDQGKCKYRRCSTDADCQEPGSPLHLSCPDPDYPAVCDTGTGQCVCSEPCGGACPDGKFCCRKTDECMAVPDACEGLTCRPGYILDVISEGQINEDTCEMDGEECACTALPPLATGYYGRFADMASLGEDKVVVTAYNETYGDLMVGTGAYDSLTWEFVDGVPALLDDYSNISADPAGPRKGIEDPGDDVGLYTSVAVDQAGVIHVAYYDATNKDLKYAVYNEPCGGCQEGQACVAGACIDPTDDCSDPGCYPFQVCSNGQCVAQDSGWTTYTVDSTGDVGLYTSIALDPGTGAPLIAYMAASDQDGNSGLRLAVAAGPDPAGAGDWNVYQGDKAPVIPECGDQEVLFKGEATCKPVTDDCDPACAKGQACDNGNCRDTVQAPSLVDLPHGSGLFADLAFDQDGAPNIVYYDRDSYDPDQGGYVGTGNLMLTKFVSGAFQTTLLDGEDKDGNDTGDVGRFCRLVMDGSGGMHVLYVDADLDDLLYLDMTQAVVKVVDDGFRKDKDGNVISVNRINGDASPDFDKSGALWVAYGDSTSHELRQAVLAPDGDAFSLNVLKDPAWDPDSPELFTGAWGFYVGQVLAPEGLLVGSFVYNLKTDPYSSTFKIVKK